MNFSFFQDKPDHERVNEQLIRASKFGVILDAKNALKKGCDIECLGIQVSFLNIDTDISVRHGRAIKKCG